MPLIVVEGKMPSVQSESQLCQMCGEGRCGHKEVSPAQLCFDCCGMAAAYYHHTQVVWHTNLRANSLGTPRILAGPQMGCTCVGCHIFRETPI